ncbi:MAG: pantoate--beta-alanine ligase [Cyclobacteriaceae bacterium]|nr:pantoate--beta-alanine ligase [Cyclobacteriaceae bacterium]
MNEFNFGRFTPFLISMQVFYKIQELRDYVNKCRLNRMSLGLVPTMGALHNGHLSLMKGSLSENNITLATIYVNPSQFNNPEDYINYPKTRDSDLEKLEKTGVQAVFCPHDQEMYEGKPLINLHFGHLEEVMEGHFRPGHFNGVGIVVAKLFNIVRPDKAYFGQKDLQQFAVISALNKELKFDIELRCMPIVREKDGLAMSSRNLLLTAEQRSEATVFYEALSRGSELLLAGFSPEKVKTSIEKMFGKHPARLEYIEITDADTLKPLSSLSGYSRVALCIAGHMGKIRLIDNTLLTLQQN